MSLVICELDQLEKIHSLWFRKYRNEHADIIFFSTLKNESEPFSEKLVSI